MLDRPIKRDWEFANALRHSDFTGEIVDDRPNRLVAATDNSIYHVTPDVIIFPKITQDIVIAARLAAEWGVALTARGGGTGTNGQSLNTGVVVDMSRYMTSILSLDLHSGTVTVEPGVVLDQLNSFLRPHGVFFAPTVSTASRATLGGMFATDASGKGSRVYGRMSDHVVAADLVLSDGSTATVSPEAVKGEILETVAAWLRPALDALEEQLAEYFPKMNRGLTGYNLDQARHENGGIDFVKLIAGSEGTLALTSKLTLRLTPIPKYRSLTVLAYHNCNAALEHVPYLASANASAIEFLDDKILALAAASPMWGELENVLGQITDAGGFLFVEFTGETREEVTAGEAKLSAILDEEHIPVAAQVITDKVHEMTALWEMRKRSVGLLAAVETSRIGLPFVEDAAVPPENLAAFVAEFSGILSKHDLNFGMFGHADVGCVHVRPMLNMRLKEDRSMIRKLSDEISELCRQHGGLIWGEHGKGMRGEYVESYVGPELYGVMRRIKSGLDPHNRLNPGKLVTADSGSLAVIRLDEAPMRGVRDAEIDIDKFPAFERSVACNGNGACHNWSPSDPMCPSYKVTSDKMQGPKGRASLLREWARLKSTTTDPAKFATHEEALAESLNSCLSCKSCTSQCPVRVSIPDMKSAFLTEYYKTRKRPRRDHLVRHMESLTLGLRHFPHLANLFLDNVLSRLILERVFALTDPPRISVKTLERQVLQSGGSMLPDGTPRLNANSVCLVADSFTGVFDTGTVASATALLTRLGYAVQVAPPIANGKALLVRGYGETFDRQRDVAVCKLEQIAADGLPIVVLEPAVVDLFRRDYAKAGDVPKVMSLDRFLHAELDKFPELPETDQRMALFLHCTEKTADPATGTRWKEIFQRFGMTLDLPATGCCGMAGLFGHETENKAMSRDLFELSWREQLNRHDKGAVATGYSCRSQSKRFCGRQIPYPAAALLARLDGTN